ncbi:MAG: hypothetical protein MUO54_08135, partial [Anaerolineales bacterium]|nr:hypothetical protein [Anaerolineales bacterium]
LLSSEVDESSRLDDFFKSEEIDDSSLRNNLLPPEDSESQESLLSRAVDESSRLDDLVQPSEPDGSSLRSDFFSTDEDNIWEPIQPAEPEDTSPLDDLFLSEESISEDSIQPVEPADTPQSDGFYSPEINDDALSSLPSEPDDPSPQVDFFSPEDNADEASLPPEEREDSPAEEEFLSPGAIEESIGLKPTEPLDADDPDLEPVDFPEDSGWLDMLQDPDSTTEEGPDFATEVTSQPDQGKPQTDWLEKIKRLNKSSDEVDDDSSFPDWLSVTGKPEVDQKDTSPEPPEQPAAAADELPEWLQMDKNDEQLNEFLQKKDLYESEIRTGQIKEIDPDDAPEPVSQTPEPADEKSESIKFPSWASEKDQSSPEKAQEIPDELKFLAGIDQSGKTVDPFQIEEEEYFDDLYSEELPTWLTKASEEESGLVIEDEISPGELPGWVEAMRPVVESTDTTGLSEDEDYIENYGPLAGIPSVLPAEAEHAFDPDQAARKPLDLIATKTHQEYVNLLKKLIGEEKKVKPIVKAAPVQTQRILRWLIAIILLLTTGGTIIFGTPVDTQLPSESQIKNSGYSALYNQIDKLSDGQPVLIAFDYQPAATAEMHAAAASVVDHLMEQGTYLSFVSTQPTGPALAEHFLSSTQEKHGYRHNQQYVNLGYLPGESAGLVSFVIAPKQIIPLAFDGSNAWGSPPLAEVESIGDFEMILVITDDPNTAKNWIEQVGTTLEQGTLNMVISAQAEPLIQPYFRASPQYLSGYVSGVIDGLNYENLLGQPNLANAAWLPFNVGIIISVGTMFIGGLANGVLSLFSRHRKRQIGEIK